MSSQTFRNKGRGGGLLNLYILQLSFLSYFLILFKEMSCFCYIFHGKE
jgi:hypothetical protein